MTSKRDIIIAKALELFSERGLSFSLSEVTCAAGLQKQSIYNYFKSKDELINVMLNLEIETYETALFDKIRELGGVKSREKIIGLMNFNINYFLVEKKLKARKWLNLLQQTEIEPTLRIKLTSIENNYYRVIWTCFEDYFNENHMSTKNLESSVMHYLVFIRGIIDGLLVFNEDSTYRAKINQLIEYYCEKNL